MKRRSRRDSAARIRSLRSLAAELRGYRGWTGDTPFVLADGLEEYGHKRLATDISKLAKKVQSFERTGVPFAFKPSDLVRLHKRANLALDEIEAKPTPFVWWVDQTPHGLRAMPVQILSKEERHPLLKEQAIYVKGLLGRWRERFPVWPGELFEKLPTKIGGRTVRLYPGAARYARP